MCISTYYLLCHASVHNMRNFNFRGALQQNQYFKLVYCFSIPMSQLRSQSSLAALVGFDLSMHTNTFKLRKSPSGTSVLK